MDTENSLILIGAKETQMSKSFLDRMAEKKSIEPSKCGNGPEHAYQWAEYKTSLLCQELYQNDLSNLDLQLFMQTMIINVLSLLNDDVHYVLNAYMTELENAQQKENSRSYPVSQSQAWKDDPSGLWGDMYSLINFAKWIWINLYDSIIYSCDDYKLIYYLMIETFQQSCFSVQGIIRGPRKNEDTQDKSPHIGISDIVSPKTVRSIKKRPGTPIEPWVHPGKSQCFVPYFGGYGAEIKRYRDNYHDNKYSSLKCGISGSTNYFIFFYLLSTISTGGKYTSENAKRLIVLLTMVLAGDGGHNIREIIFGTACAAILIKNLIDDILNELRAHYMNYELSFEDIVILVESEGNIIRWANDGILGQVRNRILTNTEYKYASGKLRDCVGLDQNRLFIVILETLGKWKVPINELYDLTADMNIVGIDEKDLIDNGVPVNDFNAGEYLNVCKQHTYDVFFGIQQSRFTRNKKVANPELSNYIQIFFALENNRYKSNKDYSCKESSDVCMKEIINHLYYGMYDTVNDSVLYDLQECGYPFDIISDYIPFA